jgi:hypothetical protein
MKFSSFIFLAAALGLISAPMDMAFTGEDGYLVQGMQLNSTNYSPTMNGFFAGDTPLYLGRSSSPSVMRLGRKAPATAELAGARRYPNLPYNRTSSQRRDGYPNSDILSAEAYHVPSIVEFLKPSFVPEGINYSYYAPALGEFASQNWTPTGANYSLHVPAIAAFLSDEWQSSRPEPVYYPYWMTEYLKA